MILRLLRPLGVFAAFLGAAAAPAFAQSELEAGAPIIRTFKPRDYQGSPVVARVLNSTSNQTLGEFTVPAAQGPVAGRYRIKFSGYTLWAAPGGVTKSFAGAADKVGKKRAPNPSTPDYDKISAGRTEEQIAKDYQERMLKLLEPVTALVNEARREHGMSIGFSYTPPNGFGIQMLASLEITKKLC